MADLEDMPDVRLVAAGAAVSETTWADAAAVSISFFAADLGVSRPLADVMVGEECVGAALLVDDLAAEQIGPSARG